MAAGLHRVTKPAVRSAIRALPLPAGSRELDVGCGIGTHTLWLAEAVSPEGHVTGIDISSEYLTYAKQLASQREGQAEAEEDAQLFKEELAEQAELANTYEAYQKLLAEHGFVDFGDLITLALKLFREHPLVLKQYQQQFRYILVDEFQDILNIEDSREALSLFRGKIQFQADIPYIFVGSIRHKMESVFR